MHRFGYPPETTWKSGYRRTRFPDDGDDGLGYDLLINTPDKRILIEVKETTDTTLQITLGERPRSAEHRPSLPTRST